MWNDKKSIALSKLCLGIFTLAVLALSLAGPWVVRWFIHFSRAGLEGLYPYFMAAVCGAVPAASLTLYSLYRLLTNIEKGQVFTPANVAYLRRVSWCCAWVAVLGAVCATFYLPFLIVAIAAGFVALLVRILKNVFAQAIAMKDELDYTI